MRPASNALTVLSAPLHVHLLKALEPGPIPLSELSRSVGLPPQSTMRVYMRRLSEHGALERRQQSSFPGTVDYGLSPAGEKLLRVGEAVQRWLQRAPGGPIALGSVAAKSVIKALVEGWDLHVVRALAARPLALTELSRVITCVNYPTLERRFTAMRAAGLIQVCAERRGRVFPYEVCDWLRTAAGPLATAAMWERRCAPQMTSAIGRNDVEAVFLLAVPLLELPAEASGLCRLSVELRKGSETEFAGVMLAVEEGNITSLTSRLQGSPDAWANGTAGDWSQWAGGQDKAIETGGDRDLAEACTEELRATFLTREIAYG